jgi:Flp pilus assembly pilin Flp
MLAVILVVVVGTLRLIGSNANNAFSSVARTLQ